MSSPPPASLPLDILGMISDGAYLVTPNRKILYWNQGARAITGFTPEEVTGRHCWDKILQHVDAAGNDLCEGNCPIVKALEKRQTVRSLVYLHHKSGYRLAVETLARPLLDENGEVTSLIEIFRPRTPTVQAAEQLKQLKRAAFLDALTQIGNRRYLDWHLRHHLELLREHGPAFGVLMIDLDMFKLVNDQFGHPMGDRVLQMVAHTLKNNLRANDIVGRWGGEEFLALVFVEMPLQLELIAEKLRVLVENAFIQIDESTQLSITISIGATLARESDTPASLIQRADQLLYESKRAGRNRVTTG